MRVAGRVILILFAGFILTCMPALAAKRVALVIGNSDYATAPLPNPVNDSRLMVETLNLLGFEVIEQLNADQRSMKRAIRDFGRKIEQYGKDTVGLFYYAGHGVQIGGINYLIPIGADIRLESDVDIEAVSANSLMRTIAYTPNSLNIVILDACRDNPFARSFRSVSRGLAEITASRGTLVAYSTSPGAVALDGEGDNSPYTEALAEAMQTPGLPVEQVFKKVRVAVNKATSNQQTPWESSSLVGSFFFKEKEPEPPPSAGTAGPAVPNYDRAIELAFWNAIKDSDDTAAFEAYLAEYPAGKFVKLAQWRLRSISAQQLARLTPTEAPRAAIEQLDLTFVALGAATLRAEPGASAQSLGRLTMHEQVTVTGKVTGKDWYRIAYQGQDAFVYAPLLREVSPTELSLWNNVRDSKRADDFDNFAKTFPESPFVSQARQRAAFLRREADLASQEAKLARAKEQITAWQKISNSTAAADFEAYAQTYPDSPFSERARERAAALRDEEARKQYEKRRLAAWQEAQQRNDAAIFSAYLENYPDGPEAEQAAARLQQLQDEARRAQLRETQLAAWKATAQSKSPQDLIAFLKQYPESPEAVQARWRLKELQRAAATPKRQAIQLAAWQAAKERDQRSDYQSYLARYPRSPQATEARQRLQQLEARLKSEQRQARQIAAWNAIKNSGDPTALESFARDNPENPHAGEARSRAGQLRQAASAAAERANREAQQLAAWNAVKNTDDARDLEDYLVRNPDSPYGSEARARQQAIVERQAAEAKAAATQKAAAETVTVESAADELEGTGAGTQTANLPPQPEVTAGLDGIWIGQGHARSQENFSQCIGDYSIRATIEGNTISGRMENEGSSFDISGEIDTESGRFTKVWGTTRILVIEIKGAIEGDKITGSWFGDGETTFSTVVMCRGQFTLLRQGAS